ncbi:hypothetical protein [Vibrio sp. 2-1(7)]|nr:hypothetical protein [Vibrio sp. 2-1(7)]NNN64431.1 hypothetical protein [Vibrio sp. 2-1(7)]
MTDSNNFFQLIEQYAQNIDWLNKILKGGIGESVLIDGVEKPTISKDIEDHYSAIMAAMEGKRAFTTKADLVGAGAPPADKPLAEVWNDTVIANNGLYGYLDGQWVKSPYDMQQFYHITASYLDGVAGGSSIRESNPNLYVDYDHAMSDLFWTWELPTAIVNGRKCLVFGSGSPAFSINSRPFPVGKFPSGKVSASLKIEQLGVNKGGSYDRILLIQYSSDSISSLYEVAREEFIYKDADLTGTGIYAAFENVAIHPDAKMLSLYVEANTWDAYVSEICVSDGEYANYRLPNTAYIRKQLLPKGSMDPAFADEISLVSSWEYSDNYLKINAKANQVAYMTFEALAVGELSPGAELLLQAEMKSADQYGVDINLFQYDQAGLELARIDMKYQGTNGDWSRSKSDPFTVLDNAHKIAIRYVNRSQLNSENPDAIIPGEFKNVFLLKANQSHTIIDPNAVLEAAAQRFKSVESKMAEMNQANANNITVDNLIRDPVSFSGFNLTQSQPFKLNGNTHISLHPSSSTMDKLGTISLPSHYFKTGMLSAGVTLSRKRESSGGVRVLLMQNNSAGVEIARETYNVPFAFSVDENDSDDWLNIKFSDVELLPDTARVMLYLDAGSGHETGVYFTKPWIVDGLCQTYPAFKDYPNYWFDSDWSGVNMSSVASDQYGFVHRDQDGPMLVIQGDDTNVYVRRYWVDAVGVFTPQNQGVFECTLFGDDVDGSVGGAEMGILFFDDSDTEIERYIMKNTVTGKFKREELRFKVPVNAKRVQIRFVRWGDKSKDARFRDVSISDASSGAITRSFYVSSVLSTPSGSASARVVYIAPHGHDQNNGTESQPLKTLSKAVEVLQGIGTIIVEDGWYPKERISAPRNGNLVIRPKGRARPKWLQGDKYEGVWTRTAGMAKVWQISTTLAPYRYLFEHLTPEGLITDDDRLPLQRGRTHRLPSFRLKRFNNVADLDAGLSGGWFFDSGAEVLYITTPGNDDPNTHTYYRPFHALVDGGHPTAHLQIDGIESWYGPINFHNLGSYLARDIRVIGSRSNGVKRDGSRGVEHHIEVCAADNDGTNTHNTNTTIPGLPEGDVPPAAYVASFDMWCHDNYDDGDSLHERSEGDFHGGLWEWNGDRGVATAYGAHVNVYNGIARDNGNNGQSSGNNTTSGEGFGSLGEAVVEEGGVGTQMVCFSCESYRNNVNYSAFGMGCTLIVNQSISRDARVAGYGATRSGLLIANNCFDSGSVVAKLEENGGRIIVKNAEPLV